MTPKEKAKELVDKFRPLCKIDITGTPSRKPFAKECASIAVKEIIKVIPMYTGQLNPLWKFWQEVIEEIKAI